MKSLKLLEQLFEAQIRAFKESENIQGEDHKNGMIFGLKLALSEVRHEIKRLQEKQ